MNRHFSSGIKVKYKEGIKYKEEVYKSIKKYEKKSSYLEGEV